MLTKKPFAGLSCASCEKDLVNMYGRRPEYLPWGKMPFRDPTDRMARIGQGFSHMLSSVNVDSVGGGMSRYESTHKLPPMENLTRGEDPITLPPDRTPMTNRKIPAALKSVNTKFPSVKKSFAAHSQERRPMSASA